MALIATLTTPAFADEWVLGASAGLLRPGGVHNDTTPAITGSFSLGLEFLNLGVVDIGATVEYTTGLSEAEIDNRDTSIEARSAWLTARTFGPVYAIGRAGWLELELDPTNTGVSDQRDEAISVGLGFSMGIRSEIIYTRVEHDFGDPTHWLVLHWAF